MSMVAFGIISVECPVILNSAHKQVLVIKAVEVTHTVCPVPDASFLCVSEDSSLTLLDMGNEGTEAGVPYRTPAVGFPTVRLPAVFALKSFS